MSESDKRQYTFTAGVRTMTAVEEMRCSKNAREKFGRVPSASELIRWAIDRLAQQVLPRDVYDLIRLEDDDPFKGLVTAGPPEQEDE